MIDFTDPEIDLMMKVIHGRKIHILRKFQHEIVQKDANYELLKVYAEDIREAESLIKKIETTYDVG